jgi:glucose/mannose transport system substrate-binding protein
MKSKTSAAGVKFCLFQQIFKGGRSMVKKQWYFVMVLMVVASLLLAACQTTPTATPASSAKPSGKLEIFSWWTAGGEAEGLNAIINVYKGLYPDVEVVNATVAGGAGTNAKAVLATRLQGGNPPDSFQVHAGLEVEKYSPTQYLVPLDDMLDAAVFPADLQAM